MGEDSGSGSGGDEEASATDTEEASATDTKDSTTAKGTPAEPATATNSTDDAVPSLRRSHGDPQGGSRREVLGMPGLPGLPRDPGILESECVQPDRRGEGQSGQCLDEHGTQEKCDHLEPGLHGEHLFMHAS